MDHDRAAGGVARFARFSRVRAGRIGDVKRSVEAAGGVPAVDPVAAFGCSPVAPVSLVAQGLPPERDPISTHGKARVPERERPDAFLDDESIDLRPDSSGREIRDADRPEIGGAPRCLALEGGVICAEIAERYGRPFRSPSAPPSILRARSNSTAGTMPSIPPTPSAHSPAASAAPATRSPSATAHINTSPSTPSRPPTKWTAP